MKSRTATHSAWQAAAREKRFTLGVGHYAPHSKPQNALHKSRGLVVRQIVSHQATKRAARHRLPFRARLTGVSSVAHASLRFIDCARVKPRGEDEEPFA